MPVVEGDEFFGAVGAEPDHHQEVYRLFAFRGERALLRWVFTPLFARRWLCPWNRLELDAVHTSTDIRAADFEN